MSVVELGSFVAGDGTFGVNSASLCEGVDSFDVSVEQLLLELRFLYHLHQSWLCFRSGSIPVILLRSHFRCKRLQPVTLW